MKKLFIKGFCLLLLLAIFSVFSAGCGIPGLNHQINGENGAENGEEEEEEE